MGNKNKSQILVGYAIDAGTDIGFIGIHWWDNRMPSGSIGTALFNTTKEASEAVYEANVYETYPKAKIVRAKIIVETVNRRAGAKHGK